MEGVFFKSGIQSSLTSRPLQKLKFMLKNLIHVFKEDGAFLFFLFFFKLSSIFISFEFNTTHGSNPKGLCGRISFEFNTTQ